MTPFTTFLSHKYEASSVNKYFFGLLNDESKIQFEVDEGKLSTNVTRLERMIRDTDAFMGIYPIVHDTADPVNLKDVSKYFRLELSMAMRAQKTGIIYVDDRFASWFRPNNKIFKIAYNHNDILSSANSPLDNIFKGRFGDFTGDLDKRLDYDRKYSSAVYQRPNVAIIRSKNYSDAFLDYLGNLLEKFGKELMILNAGQSIDEKFISTLNTVDFFILDNLEFPAHEGFLHGAFFPMIRAVYCEDINMPIPLNPLLNSFEVGYPKNVIKWALEENLQGAIEIQLATIFSPVKRFSTQKEAIQYFEKAELRKEIVFISYSGDDRDKIFPLITLLKKRFAEVFDYRDKGNSILPGRHWVKGVFDSLAKSSVGIPVYTESYFKSPNCEHEYLDMVALKDSGDMTVLPIKLDKISLDIPPALKPTQYLRKWEFDDDLELADRIVSIIDSTPKKNNTN